MKISCPFDPAIHVVQKPGLLTVEHWHKEPLRWGRPASADPSTHSGSDTGLATQTSQARAQLSVSSGFDESPVPRDEVPCALVTPPGLSRRCERRCFYQGSRRHLTGCHRRKTIDTRSRLQDVVSPSSILQIWRLLMQMCAAASLWCLARPGRGESLVGARLALDWAIQCDIPGMYHSTEAGGKDRAVGYDWPRLWVWTWTDRLSTLVA